MTKDITTKIDRPVTARLVWALENGENIAVTPESLYKVGYVNAGDVYRDFEGNLSRVFEKMDLLSDGEDLTDCEINVFRHLIEVALFYPTHWDEFKDEMTENLTEAGHIERELRLHRRTEEPSDE